MHGESDATHMLDLHTKMVLRKDIGWDEIKSMLPFEKDAFINILLKTLAEKKKIPMPTFDVEPTSESQQHNEMTQADIEMLGRLRNT